MIEKLLKGSALVLIGIVVLALFDTGKPKTQTESFRSIVRKLNNLNRVTNGGSANQPSALDTGWYRHFKRANLYIDYREIGKAYDEIDAIAEMVNTQKNLEERSKFGEKLPQFDLCMHELATSIASAIPETTASFGDVPLFPMMFTEQVQAEQLEHLQYAEKLLRLAIKWEETSAKRQHFKISLERLAECLEQQGRHREAAAVTGQANLEARGRFCQIQRSLQN